MSISTRRQWIQSSLTAGVSALPLLGGVQAAGAPSLKIAPFRFEVTPPEGHPLCGGWITPVKTVADSLEAIGYVLLGAGLPVVVCAVDWTGILNEAHIAWRTALAQAAGTTPDRVAVQCVHQHDAPFVCLRGEELVAGQKAGLRIVDMPFFSTCLERARSAVGAALPKARPVTHIATSEAPVQRIAGNRRVMLSPQGKVMKMRGSACKDAELVAMPEGLIDPMLKTVAFYHGAEKVLACHYYATHPMSHYGRGEVSSDFVGLARKRLQKEEPGCTHIYFTGCAGNVAAGKYNDGTPEARIQLTERLHSALAEAQRGLKPSPILSAAWAAQDLVPELNPAFTPASEHALLENAKNAPANRIRPAMRISFMDRVRRRVPIILSALHVNDTTLLHLPAECFVEYQLRTQQLHKSRFVATAAYGDGGPWYIPVKEAFPQGGYEVSVANCAESMDAMLMAGIGKLMG